MPLTVAQNELSLIKRSYNEFWSTFPKLIFPALSQWETRKWMENLIRMRKLLTSLLGNFCTFLGGRHSTEEEFALSTKPSWVRFLVSQQHEIGRRWHLTLKNSCLLNLFELDSRDCASPFPSCRTKLWALVAIFSTFHIRKIVLWTEKLFVP